MKAIRKFVFTVVKDSLQIDTIPVECDIPGAHVNLRPVMEWMVHEMHLHQLVDNNPVEGNLKLDGCPFWGN